MSSLESIRVVLQFVFVQTRSCCARAHLDPENYYQIADHQIKINADDQLNFFTGNQMKFYINCGRSVQLTCPYFPGILRALVDRHLKTLCFLSPMARTTKNLIYSSGVMKTKPFTLKLPHWELT